MKRSRPSPAAPKNLRNGLKWRDGRPRWEPSPASREAGLQGRNLQSETGAWLERGAAIAAADARHAWAEAIREASKGGPVGADALADLRAAIEQLPHPRDDAERQQRALVADLVDHARRLLAGEAKQPGSAVTAGSRTIESLFDAYFADPHLKAKAATRSAYSSQKARIFERFKGRHVATITRGQLADFYRDLLMPKSHPDGHGVSKSVAKLCMNTLSSVLSWAARHDWVSVSVATKLGIMKPPGRLVFWSVEEEQQFVPWCDANEFADVGDGITGMLWTGARPIDMCAANVEELQAGAWRYIPVKTEEKAQVALPGITEPLRRRILRRALAARSDGAVRHLNATPFLWDFRTGRRHTTKSFGERYREARALALAAKAVPETLVLKRVQDTRDTCVTRLWAIGTTIDRIWPWTGHSPKSAGEILREHYITLLEGGSIELAKKLNAWGRKNGLAL